MSAASRPEGGLQCVASVACTLACTSHDEHMDHIDRAINADLRAGGDAARARGDEMGAWLGYVGYAGEEAQRLARKVLYLTREHRA